MGIELVFDDYEFDGEYMYRVSDSGNGGAYVEKFEIVKETPCGYWITLRYWAAGDKKFVYKDGKNNYAKDTLNAAWENYYHRKCRHIAILKQKLYEAENRRRIAEKETGRKVIGGGLFDV